MPEEPLILTLRLDGSSQAFFDRMRGLHFPPDRNFLQAHLTLFHQLPDQESTYRYLEELTFQPFEMLVTGLINLGSGVAYRLESENLTALHNNMRDHFAGHLIKQDQQP